MENLKFNVHNNMDGGIILILVLFQMMVKQSFKMDILWIEMVFLAEVQSMTSIT